MSSSVMAGSAPVWQRQSAAATPPVSRRGLAATHNEFCAKEQAYSFKNIPKGLRFHKKDLSLTLLSFLYVSLSLSHSHTHTRNSTGSADPSREREPLDRVVV